MPVRFVVDGAAGRERARTYVPIVIAGSVEGRDEAKATYDRLLAHGPRALREERRLLPRASQERTVRVETPDDAARHRASPGPRSASTRAWPTNPLLGTGLVAGFRTSGESERPGFAWMFGRDALWTALAIHSYGDFAAARTALEFLRKFQRADGKIPHEISQSAVARPLVHGLRVPVGSPRTRRRST